MKRNATTGKGGTENDGGENDGKKRNVDTNAINEERSGKKSTLSATKEPIRRVQSANEVVNTENANTASTSASVIANDIDDFLARARAMGLNLSRQDYERARAGVSAFLRAERVANPGSSTSASDSPKSNEAQKSASKSIAKSSPAIETHTTTTASTSRKVPTTNGFNRSVSTGGQPTLSFFTAVLPTQDPNAKSRPRLDDISNLEERRRRREKRRRLREKSEREANDADCEFGSHGRRKKATSEPIEDSPSTGVGGYDSPILSGDQSPRSRALRSKISSLDMKTFLSIGLGILGQGSTGMALSQNADENLKSSHLTLQEKLQSPELSKLTRKAHVDETGRLILLPSPVKENGSNEDVVTSISGLDDISANAGGETDDSGICVNNDAISHQTKKPSGPSPGSPRRRRLSSFDSLSNHNDLNESMDNLSFLDRIMAQKKSPLRLRKEAKARERKERLLAANNDLIVMTAMSKPAPVPASSTIMPAPLTAASAASSQSTASSSQSSSAGIDGKSVRWASDFHLSPRKRTTTKEIYDYEFYGIAPTQAHSHSISSWDNGEAEALRRLQNSSMNEEIDEFGQGHARMRSQMNSTMFGSPVAMRTSQSIVPHSPGMLSLAFHDSAVQSAALLAKRGLLFGATTPGGSSSMIVTPPVPSPHEGVGNDLHNIFSQGPTLAQSPARKGLIDTETPPRLVRAKTLAAPISLAQSVFGKDDRPNTISKDPSPQRMSLMRAHSSSAIQDRMVQRQNVEANKENQGSQVKKKVPTGWASHSPGGRLDTISPAAIFGFGQERLSQTGKNQVQSQNVRVLQDSQKHNSQQAHQQQRARMESSGSISDSGRMSGQYSTSDIEGDDEHDLSPTVQMHGKRAQANAAALAARMKKRANESGHDRNSSLSASSAYDDSPLVLDTRSSKATVIARPSSGTSLARALDLPNRADRSKADATEYARNGNSMTMEWDKPDGSRVVKLVSDELQAALESGSLPAEPPARFYKLPAGWGQSKNKPQSVSYAGMIGQAILSSSDSRLSLNEIYNWIATVFPFFERGDRGWQNSIRHNLSLNKSFEKVERAANVPGKGGWWAIKHGHEDRFRNGNYYAPGTVKAAKDNALKTPKTTMTALPSSGNADDENESSSQKAKNTNKATRRKRVESERSEGSGLTEGSDSDIALSSIQVKKSSKESHKRLKKGSRTSSVNEQSVGQDGQQGGSGGMGERAIPVTLLKPNQDSTSSRYSPSPKQYNTITPSRPYQPRMMGTSSSDIGSVYASSVMAGMPVLTDASSPPSSPNHTMPPPPGGIRGAASSQSAQKQKEALMQQYHQQGVQMGYGLPSGNMYSHHYMPASPLAHMRGNSNNGTTMGQLATSANQSNSRFGSNVDSPLRHSASSNTSNNLLDASASRLIVNSPPVSNVRDTTDSEDTSQENKNDKFMLSTNSVSNPQHSPARFINHSPLRGSPLRPGGAVHQQSNGSMSNSLLSPAGMHLQMATNGNNGNLAVASTPMMQRWGMTSPVSSRLFSPAGYLTPNTHGHLTGNGASNNTPGLEDPFDYTGSLQHELDMASELHHLTSTIQGDPSPVKGFDHNSFMNRTQFHQQQQNGTLTNSVQQDMNGSNAQFHFV
ncbi:hypothetical protein L7F22_027261 [Adiantum nelumboides]|nr:hypothetical protein [Adiantum nelumboides]